MEDLVKGTGTVECNKFKISDDILIKIKSGEINEEKWLEDNIEKLSSYQTIKCQNIWLTTGWTEILKNISGTSTSHWDSTNARIGVGDSATSPAEAQTDLIGSNKTYKSMESGYPTTPSSGTIQYRAKFLTTEANYAWNESVVKNNASSVCWNRSTNADAGWGTKPSSEVWYMTFTLGKA